MISNIAKVWAKGYEVQSREKFRKWGTSLINEAWQYVKYLGVCIKLLVLPIIW